jgi:hypothetical protein
MLASGVALCFVSLRWVSVKTSVKEGHPTLSYYTAVASVQCAAEQAYSRNYLADVLSPDKLCSSEAEMSGFPLTCASQAPRLGFGRLSYPPPSSDAAPFIGSSPFSERTERGL